MKKKILVLGVAIVLLFSVVAVGTAACRFYDPSRTELLARLAEFEERLDALEEENRILRGQVALWEYRADAIRELREFADARGEENFSETNWSRIQGYVANAVVNIIAAENKGAVGYVFVNAKEDIANVFSLGNFLYISEAYNEGWLTRDAVKHISYFLRGNVIEVLDTSLPQWEWSWRANLLVRYPHNYVEGVRRINFTPQIAIPTLDDLDEKTIYAIKEVYYRDVFFNQLWIYNKLQRMIERGELPKGTNLLDTLYIRYFFGEYNGFYAVDIRTTIPQPYEDSSFCFLVSDIVFNGRSANTPRATIFTFC